MGQALGKKQINEMIDIKKDYNVKVISNLSNMSTLTKQQMCI